jgi:hypothetical protein
VGAEAVNKPAAVILGNPNEGKSDFIIKTYKEYAKKYDAPVFFTAHEQKAKLT